MTYITYTWYFYPSCHRSYQGTHFWGISRREERFRSVLKMRSCQAWTTQHPGAPGKIEFLLYLPCSKSLQGFKQIISLLIELAFPLMYAVSLFPNYLGKGILVLVFLPTLLEGIPASREEDGMLHQRFQPMILTLHWLDYAKQLKFYTSSSFGWLWTR